MMPNHSMQWTALRAAAEPDHWIADNETVVLIKGSHCESFCQTSSVLDASDSDLSLCGIH
jgi:hypothetical protein